MGRRLIPFRTAVGTLNFLLLQWFGVRVARVICADTGRLLGFRILGPIVPLTGWWGPYFPRQR